MADQEMINRVAEAIRLRDTTDEFAMARVAIKAMREPTVSIKNVQTFSLNYSSEEIWKKFIEFILRWPEDAR